MSKCTLVVVSFAALIMCALLVLLASVVFAHDKGVYIAEDRPAVIRFYPLFARAERVGPG